LWDEIGNIDFFEEIQSLQVPIYLLAGKYDMVMPTKLVENFHRSLDAERGRTLVIFEESAHFAMIEEKEKYQKLLIDVVLRELRES
jgi:pimeloyl-ACP methyl ester carboxylesterase